MQNLALNRIEALAEHYERKFRNTSKNCSNRYFLGILNLVHQLEVSRAIGILNGTSQDYVGVSSSKKDIKMGQFKVLNG